MFVLNKIRLSVIFFIPLFITITSIVNHSKITKSVSFDINTTNNVKEFQVINKKKN